MDKWDHQITKLQRLKRHWASLTVMDPDTLYPTNKRQQFLQKQQTATKRYFQEQAQLEHYKALFLYAILTIPLLNKLPPKKWQTFLIIYTYLTCSKYSSAHFVGTLWIPVNDEHSESNWNLKLNAPREKLFVPWRTVLQCVKNNNLKLNQLKATTSTKK